METEQNKNTWPTTEADRPLESIADDGLGRDGFVKTIAETIINYKKRDPLIIGLYGSWGYGKTTILNFVKEYIGKIKEKAPTEIDETLPDVIYFDPWIFANQEDLFERFLEKLIQDLRKIKGKRKWRKLKYKDTINSAQKWLYRLKVVNLFVSAQLFRYVAIALISTGFFGPEIFDSEWLKNNAIWFLLIGAILGIAQNWLAYSIDYLKNTKLGQPKLTDKRDNMCSAMKSLNNNIVIIIDEIDRLNKEETKIIFQLVKATFNFPNLIFILAFDNEKVAKLISENNGEILNGKDYIEKIVQIPFPIPRPDRALFEEFIGKRLNETIYFIPEDDFDRKRMNHVYLSGLRNILLSDNNPRKIIRFFNSVKSHLYSLRKKVDTVDFIAIRAIQYFFPRIYNYIASKKIFFTPIKETDLRAQLEAGERKEEFDKELSEILKNENRDIEKLINDLFPILESTPDEEIKDIWLREKRICSPKNFDTYFTLKMSEEEIEYADIEKFLSNLENTEDFMSALESRIADDTLPTFLGDISSYADEISLKKAKYLMISLFDIAEKFPKKYNQLSILPDSTISFIVRKIIKRLGKIEGQRIFEAAIDRSNGISIPLLIVDSWVKSKSEGKKQEIEIDENLVGLSKDNIVRNMERLSGSGFLRVIRYLHPALDKWFEWGDKKVKLNYFIEKAIEDVVYLPIFLVHYVDYQIVSTSAPSTYNEYKFNFKKLAKLGTDMDKVYNKVQFITNDQDKKYDEDQSRAAKLYRMDYANFKKTGENPKKYYKEEEIF